MKKLIHKEVYPDGIYEFEIKSEIKPKIKIPTINDIINALPICINEELPYNISVYDEEYSMIFIKNNILINTERYKSFLKNNLLHVMVHVEIPDYDKIDKLQEELYKKLNEYQIDNIEDVIHADTKCIEAKGGIGNTSLIKFTESIKYYTTDERFNNLIEKINYEKNHLSKIIKCLINMGDIVKNKTINKGEQ